MKYMIIKHLVNKLDGGQRQTICPNSVFVIPHVLSAQPFDVWSLMLINDLAIVADISVLSFPGINLCIQTSFLFYTLYNLLLLCFFFSPHELINLF